MRRWDYEYYRFYVAWKGCFARLAEVFTYRAYSYLCVRVTYKHLLGARAKPAEYLHLIEYNRV